MGGQESSATYVEPNLKSFDLVSEARFFVLNVKPDRLLFYAFCSRSAKASATLAGTNCETSPLSEEISLTSDEDI